MNEQMKVCMPEHYPRQNFLHIIYAQRASILKNILKNERFTKRTRFHEWNIDKDDGKTCYSWKWMNEWMDVGSEKKMSFSTFNFYSISSLDWKYWHLADLHYLLYSTRIISLNYARSIHSSWWILAQFTKPDDKTIHERV